MVSAKAAAIRATLDWVDKMYGGVEGYLIKEVGFSERDVAVMRKNLVAEEKAIL